MAEAAIEAGLEASTKSVIKGGITAGEEAGEGSFLRSITGSAKNLVRRGSRRAAGNAETDIVSAARSSLETDASAATRSATDAAVTDAATTEKSAVREALDKEIRDAAAAGSRDEMKSKGLKAGLLGAAGTLFAYYYQTEDSCKEGCQEADGGFVSSLKEPYRPLWDEKCKDKLESQDCKDFCESTDETSDPPGVCSQNNRTQRATRQTVEAGVTPVAMAATAAGAFAESGSSAVGGALFSILKGIFAANPIVGIACVIICCGGIIYKVNSVMSGGGKQTGNKNIKIYFLFIFFMFIIYNERK